MMLPAWLLGPLVPSLPSHPRTRGSHVFCAQIEYEKSVDLQRRVRAVPNLDLFLLQERPVGREVRCIRTERDGLEALLAPHAGRSITAYSECRQKLWEFQVEPLVVYHTFMLLELDGGDVVICTERHGEHLEIMIGEGKLMQTFATRFRATGERRCSSVMQERQSLGLGAGTPQLMVADLLAWLSGPLARTWQTYCLFRANGHHYIQQVQGFLDGTGSAEDLEAYICESDGQRARGGDLDICCTASQAHSRLGWMRADTEIADRGAALVAVRASGDSLQFVDDEFRGDREVVLAAVTKDGRALRFAAEHLREDREIVLAAVLQDPAAHEFVSEAIKVDPEVILAMLTHEGGAQRIFPVSAKAWASMGERLTSGVEGSTPCNGGQLGSASEAIAGLLGHGRARVRQAACEALGRLPGEAPRLHAAALAARLRDEEWTVREAACQALRQLGEAAVPFASDLAACLEDERWPVRLAACKALGHLGGAAALHASAVAKCLAHDSPQLRVTSRKVLERMGAAAVPALAECLADPHVGARQAACQALGRLGADIAAPAMERLAACLLDERWQVRLAACEALGLLGEAVAAPQVCALAACLGDEDGDVRTASLQALAQLGGGALAPGASLAAGHLGDERWAVRATACKALGMMGGSAEPYAGMLAHLARYDGDVAGEACAALQRLGMEV